LAGLWAACGLTRPWNDPAKDIAFALAGPASDILVGSEDGRIIASVMVGHDGHRGAVYYLSADPARRGEGLGRMMMAAAENWLKARGVWKLNLMVRNENTGVLTFYEGLGYEDGQVIVMGKWLND
jgi:ribosomal protein S18 acetylase RimI-like enzyme